MMSFILILVAGLLTPGIVAKTKAITSGAKGASVFQPLYDTLRLVKKASVYAGVTGFMFKLGPPVYLASVLSAAMLLPFSGTSGLVSFAGDFIVFALLFSLGRFFMLMAAMDTGSAFEGMGVNREALYALLAEPAFFILVASWSMFSGHSSFSDIMHHLHPDDPVMILMVLFSVYLLFKMLPIEASRIPVDDPKTHLELTMIHEVAVLDHSGFDLALIRLANDLKFGIYGILIFDLIVPYALNPWQAIPLFLCSQAILGIAVGINESFRARFKLSKIPSYILTLSAVAFVIFLTALLYKFKNL